MNSKKAEMDPRVLPAIQAVVSLCEKAFDQLDHASVWMQSVHTLKYEIGIQGKSAVFYRFFIPLLGVAVLPPFPSTPSNGWGDSYTDGKTATPP